ncbi:helix-turn-helix transcriptional regulator [Paenibacillus larvae]
MQVKLIALRKYFGITQKEMAKLLGIDVRTYINKERGVTQFKANEMFFIARKLNKNIGEIFLPTDFIKHEVLKGEVC